MHSQQAWGAGTSSHRGKQKNIWLIFSFYPDDLLEMEWPLFRQGGPQYYRPQNSARTWWRTLLLAHPCHLKHPCFWCIRCSFGKRRLLQLSTNIRTRQTSTITLKAVVSGHNNSSPNCFYLRLPRHVPWVDSTGENKSIWLLPRSPSENW
jgi:hypothetical protein